MTAWRDDGSLEGPGHLRAESVDPDLGPAAPTPPGHVAPDVVAAIAAGGVLGAEARYAMGSRWPTSPGHFPWSTFTVNVVGCLLIGMLMVVVLQVWPVHRLLRPFLGVGVLGGFTTFSTYAVEGTRLLSTGHPVAGVCYVVGTVVTALAAVQAGSVVMRSVLRARPA